MTDPLATATERTLAELARVQAERDRLAKEVEAMRIVITAFCTTVSDANRAAMKRGQGGQQVSFHGDFASAPPSVLTRLEWWARELEKSKGDDV